jgi:hypothetical protein
MSTVDANSWTAQVQTALNAYAADLLQQVGGRLIKPRTQIPAEETLERILATIQNPPLIDRRIRECPESSRQLLTLMSLSRRNRWKIGHLVLMLASLGHAEGYAPLLHLLDSGLLFPETTETNITDFTNWIGAAGQLNAVVFTHPSIADRVRDEPLKLPVLPSEVIHETPRPADGWDWLLRLAVVWQQVRAASVRLTQSFALFKRDLARLQADPLLSTASPQELLPAVEAGVLALFWAVEAKLLNNVEGELKPGPIQVRWDQSLANVQSDLLVGLLGIEFWDPLRGYLMPNENGVSAFPSVALLSLLLLAPVPANEWVDPSAISEWLWTQHPAWSGSLSKEEQKLRGKTWITNWLFGVAHPLGLIEVVRQTDGFVRLSPLGRHLFQAAAEPVVGPAFPQTLLVQPNAEILAYRQGLSPQLIAQLSRFAQWKILGPACTLELNAEQTYLGLESGLPVAAMLQTLTRHGMKPVPAAVADLLQRWANKRERISVYSAATLVEFQTAADLEAAISRGIVSIKVTDRIGLTADGTDPEFKHLRSIGNRDYEAKPQRCLTIASDGVTITVDTSQSDLLLEAEITRVAEPMVGDSPSLRRFTMTPASINRAQQSGWGLAELDQWFHSRAGVPMPPAARLFLSGTAQSPWHTARHLVLHLPNPELTDGVMQWPATASLINERIGQCAVVVLDEHVAELEAVLMSIGVSLQMREPVLSVNE